MMSHFFNIGHNSYNARGFPWIDKIIAGFTQLSDCPQCGASRHEPLGDIQVTLEATKGRQWPDVLGCGAHPFFIVSARVIEAWRVETIASVPVGGRVSFVPPLPEQLQSIEPPAYFWLDGEKMLGAKMAFNASGFLGMRVCPMCGRHIYDVGATYDRQRAGVCPYVFVEGTWDGMNLFTTDLSPAMFFCTEAVMECARKHRHTNFRFTPVEAGNASWSRGIDYLGKQWPPQHPLRPSEGKTIDQWVEKLRNPAQRYEARRALLDLGKDAAPVVPSLISMLHDETLRREAALLLSALGKLGVPLGVEGEAAARQHDDWFQNTLGR